MCEEYKFNNAKTINTIFRDGWTVRHQDEIMACRFFSLNLAEVIPSSVFTDH